MLKRSRLPHRQDLPFLAATFLALALLFTGCSVKGLTPESPVSYTPGAGQIVIRLITSPGNIFPSLNAIPLWELYGDGTLLYQPQASRSNTLLQAQLSSSDIASILDVVVNQDAFFANPSQTLYGKGVADTGSTSLTVHANNQQKTVGLFDETGAPPEDQHMFSILHFLESYQPASSHPYSAPGVVVLVDSAPEGATPAALWPYPDISLQQVAAQENPTFFDHGTCPATEPTCGYFPLYGQRGTDLLTTLNGQRTPYMSQNGQIYSVWAWLLLPEDLIVQADGKQWVETEGMNAGRWPLLPGTH